MSETANDGYVLLWRKSMDTEIWRDGNLWRLFTYCLMSATHKEITLPALRSMPSLTLQPGQFATGRRSLRSKLYPEHSAAHSAAHEAPARIQGEAAIPHEMTIWRWLMRLQELRMVRVDVRQGYSVITVCNWARYQPYDCGGVKPCAPLNSSGAAPLAHIQEDNTCMHEDKIVRAQAAHEPVRQPPKSAPRILAPWQKPIIDKASYSPWPKPPIIEKTNV